MRNILKSLFIATVTLLNVSLLAAKDPSSTLDVKEAAGGSTYYTLDAVPDIKNLDWVGYNSTGSGNGGCVTVSHWKLSNSRTITFIVRNCTKIEAKDAYFSKDATTELKYSVNGSTAVAFATNGDLKKTCASGSFETGNTGEITVVLSADNDVVLNNILFYSGEGGDTPSGGDDPAVPEKSNDASLKSLEYYEGGSFVSVPGFAPDKFSYSIALPADYVGGAPSIQAEQNDEKANIDVSQATSLPGTAKVVVTAEDGTTKLTYTVAFSKAGDDPTPGGGDDPQPTGDVYAHWRFSGSDIPAIGSSESGTNIKVEFLTSDDSKSFNTESVGYNAAVPDDMKSQGTKGVKNSANKLYLKVTVPGGFKANDVVTICGYNPWKVSSTEAHEGDIAASVATGTSKTDYNIGSFTLSADAEALYMMRADGSGACICAIKVTRDGGETPPEPEKSDDASLKSISLEYGGKSAPIPDFSPTQYSYDIPVPAEYALIGTPTVLAEANDENATITITQATGIPGTATIVVTAEDGTTKLTYTISFSIEGEEPPATVAVTGVTLNKTAITLYVGNTVTLSATVVPSDATNKNVTWSSDKESVASVNNGVVTAKAEGSATITVTTEDGDFTATCKVTVQKEETPDVPVPSTSLTLHEPGIYEEVGAQGGYDAALSIFEGREYEVFYAGRFEEKVDGTTKKGLTIQVNPPTDKIRGITKNESESSYEAADGWFKGSGGDKGTGFAVADEFEYSTGRCQTLKSTHSVELHIKGYDQFSLYGADKKVEPSKPQNNKVFKVLIDDEETEMPISTAQTIRRFDISVGEHVIRIECGDDCLFGGFSLRVAQIPSVKYLKGNDSTQVVLQTENLPRPITYYTKYNSMGETRVVWEGEEATGIDLSIKGSDGIGDTLVLSGKALCPVGVYDFHVASFYNGKETKRLPSGKITVNSDIRAVGEPTVEVYQGEMMEELEFTYHALSADDITLTWSPYQPDGIIGYGEDGKYYINGTPTQAGEFSFTISVKDGNSIDGLVHIMDAISGDNLVLYLYTNKDAYKNDGIIDLLTDYKFIPRKALREGLRPAADYKKYQWALISEDANADNAEVLALTKESSILPVLNMKSFSYAKERLSWGDPNNGGLKTPDALSITVQRDDHPIFQVLNKSKGSKIQVLSDITEKGLMPIDITLPGTHCLATSLARAKEDYFENGEPQTFLHEVPAAMRGGKKYICMPIAMSSSKNFTPAGKQLIHAVVNYLLNDEPSIQVPQLQITSFTINGIAGKIDQEANKIIFEIDLAEHEDIDKYAVIPYITVASDYTHVTPASGKAMDFSESWSFPVPYEVSDYINRRVYEVAIRFYTSVGIEDVYATGDWVNIYDIFGRKISTTNEDIYRMVLPRGIYVIVTETGETFKILR